MFTDERRRIVWDELRERDLGLFAALLTTQTLEAAAARADAALSEEAFAQARAAMPAAYWRALILLLGELFEARHPDVIRWNGFRLLALDGTCVTLPRHKALGEHFGYARNKNGRPAPQAR